MALFYLVCGEGWAWFSHLINDQTTFLINLLQPFVTRFTAVLL